MNQYVESTKLPTYLQSSSTDAFLELKCQSPKTPPSNMSTLSPSNSSLVDLCAFDLLRQRFVETSPSPSNTSANKPFITSSDFYIRISPVLQTDCPNQTNEMFIPSSDSTETDTILTTSLDTSSVSTIVPLNTSCDDNPNISTLLSNSKIKYSVQQSSPDSSCTPEELSKVISNQQYDPATPHLNDSDTTLDYELSSFITKVEQIPNIWAIDPTSMESINDNDDQKRSLQMINKPTRRSPILHRSLISPSKSMNTYVLSNIKSPRSDAMENSTAHINGKPKNTSPKYRPKHSYIHPCETQPIRSDHPNCSSENNLIRTSKISRRSCRSPVYTRRPQQQKQKIINTNVDTTSSSHQSMALLSLDINGSILPVTNEIIHQHHTINTSSSSTNNNNKRSFESPTSEQILIKRRYQKSTPTIIIQRQYCISYPINIPKCVDCQTINSSDSSVHPGGCRFQHCRTLQYLGQGDYEIEGFTTVDKAKSQDLEYFLVPTSGEQTPLNLINANYMLLQISKLFCLMMSYEETERLRHNEKEIIWKRCIPGWREVCDECSTTLFNHHYMCKKCGYMICIECANECSHTSSEKRKKVKRTCDHANSYCLSEFIPWNILMKLRNDCIDYLSKLQMDSSIRLYHSSRTDCLSIFIKSLKMKRLYDIRDVQKTWSSIDCNYDSTIEFYCNGRLPVFNQWKSENAKCFFRRVWAASCPVLVKRVHQNLSKTLWHPHAFKRHMIDHRDTPALWDCETLTPIPTNETILTRFWDGFERLNVRLRDNEHGGRTRILKLKDWPTKKDFASVFPTRLHDLMINIPFSDYTRRSYSYNGVSYHGGVFNIVERLPIGLVKPDLGPKLYIAYSQLTSQASKKAGTTNLHIDVSDAVNVLVYVGIGGQGDDGSNKDQELRQVEEEILNSNIDDAQLQRLRNGERPGALWHLFRSDDAKKIREYIGRSQRKIPGTDSIHDQTMYLEKEDLENLKRWNQIEAYPILQFLGDAVFIPSGAPHQVKNLHSCIKIAEDFVSPENLDRCLITTNEFRSLSKTHTNHADILQAKNILYYATRDALNSLVDSNETHSQSSTFDLLN